VIAGVGLLRARVEPSFTDKKMKEFFFAAASEDDMRAWMRALAESIILGACSHGALLTVFVHSESTNVWH
jgi:hypothetical protein